MTSRRSPFDQICQRLKQDDASLTLLNLNDAGIGSAKATQLGQALARNSHVVVLFLDHNEMTGDIAVLADALGKHKHLKFVYMSYNAYLGNAGAQTLASRALASSSSPIRILKMTDCGIGSAGAKALAVALESSNHGLEQLDLDGNDIGTEGAVALAQHLPLSLQSLSLRSNEKITEPDLVDAAFCKRLSQTTPVTRLTKLGLDSELSLALQYWLQLNAAGRALWGSSSDNLPHTVLPRICSQRTMQEHPSVLFTFLQQRPDVLDRNAPTTAAGSVVESATGRMKEEGDAKYLT